MTELEQIALNHLVEAWNAFLLLPTEHADDVTEFRHGIHALQQLIMARPVRRQINKTYFRAKAGEDAQAKTGDASVEPVSRASETSRQKGLDVEIADGCQHGGREEPAAADRHAPNSEPPMQVNGDSEDLATAIPRKSVSIPAAGDMPIVIDGSHEASGEPIPESPRKAAEAVPETAAIAVATIATATDATTPASDSAKSAGEAGASVLPTNSADARSDLKALYRKTIDDAFHMTDREIEQAVAALAVNERCLQPKSCKFGTHPQKITCFSCGSDWAAKAKNAEAA